MAEIGRPNTQNSFSNIKKYVDTKPKNTRKLSDNLNRAAGVKIEDQFVDRKTHNKLGKDGFLKLLANQMQNQDPMKPMDQKQFAADLAQFSQLEQMTNMNTNLSKLGSNVPMENKFYGASFLGKEVTSKGTTLDHLGNGKITQIPFNLPTDATKLMVRVFDKQGQMVAQIDTEGASRGRQVINWDGVSSDGTLAAKGEYRIDVRAWDKDFNQFKGETQAKGIVTAVNFVDGETVLEVDHKKEVFLRDVTNFKLPKIENKIPSSEEVSALRNRANQSYNQSRELNQ